MNADVNWFMWLIVTGTLYCLLYVAYKKGHLDGYNKGLRLADEFKTAANELLLVAEGGDSIKIHLKAQEFRKKFPFLKTIEDERKKVRDESLNLKFPLN